MKFRIHVKDDVSNWWEDYNESSVVDMPSAEEEGRKMVRLYNWTLRPGEAPRTFIEAQLVGEGELDHDWEKTNLVTVTGKHGASHDTLRCKRCGCEARRYGLSNIRRVGKWAKPKWEHCHPKGEA